MNYRLLLPVLAALTALPTIGCKGGLVLSPHRSRESDMAPAAAEGRFSSVMDRASNFEQQNAKSRDVYWYRAWRGAALVGLGQRAEGRALLDEILTDISQPSVSVNEVSRLRMFIYDQKAKAALADKRPDIALPDLERALSLAGDTSVNGGPCDRDLALAARHQQIVGVATAARDAARAQKARMKVARYAEEWSTCLAKRDYPSLAPATLISDLLMRGGNVAPLPVAPVAAVPVTNTQPVGQPVAAVKPVAAPAPAPAPVAAPAPTPTPVAAPTPTMPSMSDAPAQSKGPKPSGAKYAPIDATPWQPHLESLVALLERRQKGLKGDAMIRTDGAHRALRLRLDASNMLDTPALLSLFKGTVIFFERTRAVDPSIDQVLVVVNTKKGAQKALAEKNDIVDLFVDRISEQMFLDRLVAPR